MKRHLVGGALVALSAVALVPARSEAAVYARPQISQSIEARLLPIETVQYWRGRPGGYGRYYGPPRYAYRPWYRRPYYGTIVGGIALGTIIGVTAYGLAPRPPRPDLCWYWADRDQSRGYWDYC